MIALLTLLTLGAAEAAEAAEAAKEPKVSVSMDTGLKPFGLPISSLLGGGLRVGVILGPVTPFAGGSATYVSGSDKPQGNDFSTGLSTTLLTGQLGVRFRIAQLEAAETYLLASALLTDHSGAVHESEGSFERVTRAGFNGGIGGFGGGGVDARVSDGVSIGVEGGVAYTAAKLYTKQKEGNEKFDDELGGNAVFTYTNLHLTWWIGGKS